MSNPVIFCAFNVFEKLKVSNTRQNFNLSIKRYFLF